MSRMATSEYIGAKRRAYANAQPGKRRRLLDEVCETAGNAGGLNGRFLWESYVAGLDSENEDSQFMARIEMQADGTVKVTWTPDLSKDAKPRKYTTLGKATLLDKNWMPVTEQNKSQMHFFKVKVEIE